jgi:hypothetical protein
VFHLNPENVKIVLELNNYGNTTAEMPLKVMIMDLLFFVSAVQRVDAEEEK